MNNGEQSKFGMTIDEVAGQLGVHRNTVQLWIKSKELRAIKLGRRWRILPEDLKTFLDKRANMNVNGKAAA